MRRQPEPPLRYAYPPLDRNILQNISSALSDCPRFYTQVLHLMNKMNLPAPFGVPAGRRRLLSAALEAGTGTPAFSHAATQTDSQRSNQARGWEQAAGLLDALSSDDEAEEELPSSGASVMADMEGPPHKTRKTVHTLQPGGAGIKSKRPIIQVNIRPRTATAIESSAPFPAEVESESPTVQTAEAALAHEAACAALEAAPEGLVDAPWQPASAEELSVGRMEEADLATGALNAAS
ncbi:hypothetical protein CYMTET_54699 [Cymbomonas tetramitiformis]|uniref:Uncharacterized protein n=1 Tax=Cymbomonas tetramitiformis TaxID=36881 RepID=A0AAE0BG73_9CHLO|nr:hypothetical protein CYMTET_54699 [Cymbomonas tetramitiformis]